MRATRELRTVPGERPLLRLDLPIWVVRQAFSFEAAFVLFLLAPLLKTDPRLAWFPLDMENQAFVWQRAAARPTA